MSVTRCDSCGAKLSKYSTALLWGSTIEFYSVEDNSVDVMCEPCFGACFKWYIFELELWEGSIEDSLVDPSMPTLVDPSMPTFPIYTRYQTGSSLSFHQRLGTIEYDYHLENTDVAIYRINGKSVSFQLSDIITDNPRHDGYGEITVPLYLANRYPPRRG